MGHPMFVANENREEQPQVLRLRPLTRASLRMTAYLQREFQTQGDSLFMARKSDTG
jgi:hypothetical protein